MQGKTITDRMGVAIGILGRIKWLKHSKAQKAQLIGSYNHQSTPADLIQGTESTADPTTGQPPVNHQSTTRHPPANHQSFID
jgi:hypothetical protein